MSWMLYELSKHADSQTRVHEEITILRAQTGCHVSLTSAHYDSMPYFNAVIKETLRLHPILPILVREADEHDTIPLSILVKSKTGSLLPDVPIRKGQRILLHLGAYNRLTQVWGDDADSWNPVRFIDEKKEVVVGMYGNLYVFMSVAEQLSVRHVTSGLIWITDQSKVVVSDLVSGMLRSLIGIA
ncbi:hypothetical protein HHX47_DHR6000704 [Lentinula edodes]|nr:hypothetical protein HHX47_DHR6000704 [Lentinula edodes]